MKPAAAWEPADLGLAAMAVTAATAGMLWAGGALSALVCGHPIPSGRPLGGMSALAHPQDPSVGWRAPMGPAVVYWLVTTTLVMAVGGVAATGWHFYRSLPNKRRNDLLRNPGLATRSETATSAGRKTLLRRAQVLRPSLERARPVDVGFRLGRARGVECWMSVEDSMVLLGPPRSGKGMNVVVPSILDAPGPVVTTSTRPDNLTLTMRARARVGPVAVFDPQRRPSGGS